MSQQRDTEMVGEALEQHTSCQGDLDGQRTTVPINIDPQVPSDNLGFERSQAAGSVKSNKSRLSRIISKPTRKPSKGKEHIIAEEIPETDLAKGIVGWEAQDDPEMPLNFSKSRKWLLLSLIGCITFMAPFSSTIFASGVEEMDLEFGNTNSILTSLTVSVFVLGFAVGPLFLSPLSEIYGRRPVLAAGNAFFSLWQIGCALAPNINTLIAFRFLAGVGGSGCLSIGGGVIADLFPKEERGLASALFALGPLFGPIIGPICGGFIAEQAGWRWIFWVLLIATGIVTIGIEIFNKETYHPVLIQRKLERLSKEHGRSDLISCYHDDAAPKTPMTILLRGLVRPLKLLTRSPIVFILALYMSVIYGLLYLFFTTLDIVYIGQYHWRSELTGLLYIGMGIGFMCGIIVVAKLSDVTVVRMTKANGGVFEPEMRLPACVFFGCFIPITFFWCGWAIEKDTHWIVPIIGLFPFGFGMMGIFIPIQTYLIDSFPMYAASAIAAITSMRSIFGAFLPLAGPSLFKNLGYGWGNSLLGFIAVALIPAPALIYKFGGKIRKGHPIEL